ncbi:putative 39S ribosomal protein L24, mitochondrial [Smittium culicis]|uniref:Putative 39S ribosomal protein L24, mitochondrial n=1 Tax=Smittium culicis TaxID=133412 RepID=A0A1R1YP86_9FUNG|nr:putative 39S ribosomal protein L24, mitochondrial [Smittium culicis]
MTLIHKSILKQINPRVSKVIKPLLESEKIKSWKIVKGDQVMVISGKDKGKSGRVVEVTRSRNTVTITNVNVAKKSVPKSSNTPSGVVLKEMPVHVTNVALVDPSDGRPTKVKLVPFVDPETGKKEKRRYALASGTYIPKPKYMEYQNIWADGDKDTMPEDVTKVTYVPLNGERPMPSDVLREIANRRRSLI